MGLRRGLMAIFASGLLPGEVAEGELRGDRLEEVRIVTPAPTACARPAPMPARVRRAQLQHVSDSFLAGWKQGVVAQALAQQGLAAPFRGPVLTSPPASRRRATLSGRRTKGGVLMGFHARGRDLVIPVPQCRLLHPDLMAGLPALEALVSLGGSRSAEVQLTVTRSPWRAGCGRQRRQARRCRAADGPCAAWPNNSRWPG